MQAVEELRSADKATDERFSDMQVSLSRSGQQEAEVTNAAIAKVQGDSDEKVAVLRVRLGRLENSLEALRQATAEDAQEHHDDANAPQVFVGADKDLTVGEGRGTPGEFAEGVGGDELEIWTWRKDEGLPLGVGDIDMVADQAH